MSTLDASGLAPHLPELPPISFLDEALTSDFRGLVLRLGQLSCIDT
jgi:hypothetical protein